MVQDTLLDSFRAGRRNYTIFQVGKATLLRVSDVMKLKKTDVSNIDFNPGVRGAIKYYGQEVITLIFIGGILWYLKQFIMYGLVEMKSQNQY